MTKSLRNIIAFVFVSMLLPAMTIAVKAQTPAPVAPNKVSVKVDTVAMTMGERTTVRVEVLKNGHVGGMVMPITRNGDEKKPPMLGDIEVRQIDVDSMDLGNGRVQVNYDILIQPFKHGDYNIGPFKFVVDGDTMRSNIVALKVLEPEMPQEMVDSLWINPMRGTLSIEARWYDWVPDWFTDYWYWWLTGLVLIGLAVLVFVLYKKNGKTLLPGRKRIPPYERATRRLEELKRKRLHEPGHDKAYYTELTDILRQYLGGRFRIYALEMTSSQILEQMAANEQTASFTDSLRPMFTVADFVKFAKQESTADEKIRSFNAVNTFVQETRPVEIEQAKQKPVRKKTTPKQKSTKKKK